MASFYFRNKTHFLFIEVALFIAMLLLTEFAVRAYREASLQQSRLETLDRGAQLRAFLESEINQAAFLATGVESYVVAREGSIEDEEIQRILALIFERNQHFRNIGLAPGNQLTWVYPEAGNESVLGLNYADLPEQWPAIQRVIETGQGILSGPLELVQGGNGLIYRSPVYINDNYWGLLSTVIDADSLLSLIRSAAGDLASRISLRNVDDEGQPGRTFFGDSENFNSPLELTPVRVPGGEWQMAIQLPENVGSQVMSLRISGVFISILVAVFLGSILRMIWQRNLLQQLDSEVLTRTAELSETNDLLDSVLSAARSFAIIATDLSGTIIVFNNGAERMLGYSADEMVGKHQPDIFLLNDELRERAAKISGELGRRLIGNELLTYRISQGGTEELMIHYKHRDGHLIPVQVVISALTDLQGKVRGYLGIAEDVSERLRNQTLKDQFISTVSHELRTPLTAITGALGLMRSGSIGALPETVQSMVEIAHNNSQRLASLVNDLLDVEKLMAGRMVLYPDKQEIADLVHSAVSDLLPLAKIQNVELKEHANVSACIWVDSARFQQVLTNLLSNAIKFSPPGGQVSITTALESGRIRIMVLDQGSGIPESFQDHIFQRFAQAEAGDSRQKAGTGLGLAISKELTEQMGGCIGFEAERSEGCCFWVEFPLYNDARSGNENT
ncbi:ATP-binding protein [Pseudohongiella sp. SYSU M77423]|uniref:ATP-binding protein n=1 Tax=Pseudohongiella sp. SYSU M77423 TaxID=3042312 RepID=UPI00247FBC71|nr:ATP-binding protein [Pseudohongiella sp. SYSU M77423]MDH7943129.1 ATP-binding protein [Pseudohongiella sp. SYSU M77423]